MRRARLRHQRKQEQLSATVASAVPVRSLQETLTEMMLPSSTSGVYDLATAQGLATMVYETGMKSGLEAVAGASRVTLPNGLIDALAQSRLWIASARRRMPPAGDPPADSMARWVLRAAKNRNQAVALGTQMEFLHAKGLLTPELMDAYNGWLESTQMTMNDLADLLRRPDVRTAFNAVTAVTGSDVTADEAFRLIRLPVPRFLPRDTASELAAAQFFVVALIVVLVVVVVGLYVFYTPERIEAEGQLADAETRRAVIDEAVRRAREGGSTEDLDDIINRVVAAGARQDTGKFPWGWVLLGVAALGIGYVAFADSAAPIRARIRSGASSARQRLLPPEPETTEAAP